MSRGRAARSDVRSGRILRAQCHGEAWRRITDGEPLADIVTEIRRMVGDRASVLVEEAGTVAGSWAARPTALGTELVVAAVLIQAAGRVDPRELQRYVREGFERASAPPHTAS